MSRRNRWSGSPVSFFSFQDIITSVTGILILVTLLMALELVVRADIRQETMVVADPKTLAAKAAVQRAELDRIREQTLITSEVVEQVASISPLTAAAEAVRVNNVLAGSRLELEELNRQEASLAQSIESIRDGIRSVKADAKRLTEKSQLIAAEAQQPTASKRLVMLPGEGTKKQPIIIDCSASKIVAMSLDMRGSTTVMGEWTAANATDRLSDLADKSDADDSYFVLYVRPDAVAVYPKLISILKRKGFDVGWDAISDDVVLIDTEATK